MYHLEFYDTDGATGAARAAGVGLGKLYRNNAFNSLTKLDEIHPISPYKTSSKKIMHWNSFYTNFIPQ